MKKLFSILLIMSIAIIGATNSVDAAKRKTARKSRTSTSSTITPTADGISVKTFCYTEYEGKDCGRVILIRDTDELLENLKTIGFEVTSVKTEVRYDEAGLGPEDDPEYTAYIYTLDRPDVPASTSIVIDSDGMVEVKLVDRKEFDTFLAGCKKLGYRLSYDNYYTDGAKCHWSGSSLEINRKDFTITFCITSEA